MTTENISATAPDPPLLSRVHSLAILNSTLFDGLPSGFTTQTSTFPTRAAIELGIVALTEVIRANEVFISFLPKRTLTPGRKPVPLIAKAESPPGCKLKPLPATALTGYRAEIAGGGPVCA